MMDAHVDDSARPEENVPDVNHHHEDGSNGNLLLENDLSDGNQGPADTYDQLLQVVMDLRFQNDVLKSQFEGFRNVNSVHSDSSIQKGVGGLEDGESDTVKELQERIQLLNKEFLEEKQTRIASEEALKHLQTAYSESEAKAQELSEKLAEGMIMIALPVWSSESHSSSRNEQIWLALNITIWIIICLLFVWKPVSPLKPIPSSTDWVILPLRV